MWKTDHVGFNLTEIGGGMSLERASYYREQQISGAYRLMNVGRKWAIFVELPRCTYFVINRSQWVERGLGADVKRVMFVSRADAVRWCKNNS